MCKTNYKWQNFVFKILESNAFVFVFVIFIGVFFVFLIFVFLVFVVFVVIVIVISVVVVVVAGRFSLKGTFQPKKNKLITWLLHLSLESTQVKYNEMSMVRRCFSWSTSFMSPTIIDMLTSRVLQKFTFFEALFYSPCLFAVGME